MTEFASPAPHQRGETRGDHGTDRAECPEPAGNLAVSGQDAEVGSDEDDRYEPL
jgi:hypothetical protein